MRKSDTHATYTKEEKNEIVRMYIKGEMGYTKLTRYYDLPSSSTLHYWKKQYLETGSVFDNRGKSFARKGNYTQRKKLRPEEMSREELIKYVEAVEDIKKLMVFLKKQKKNIK